MGCGCFKTTAQNMCTQIKFQIRTIKKINQDTTEYDFKNDGSTFNCEDLQKNDQCYWIGDSQIRIYDKETELFKSKNHNARNKKELNRLQNSNTEYSINKVPSLCVVDPSTLTMKKYPQIHFFTNNNCEKMMVSRALGHNEKLFPC